MSLNSLCKKKIWYIYVTSYVFYYYERNQRYRENGFGQSIASFE